MVEGFPSRAYDAMLSCLQADDSLRPTFAELSARIDAIIRRMEDGGGDSVEDVQSSSSECVQCAISTVSPLMMPVSSEMPRQARSAHPQASDFGKDASSIGHSGDCSLDVSGDVCKLDVASVSGVQNHETFQESRIDAIARRVEDGDGDSVEDVQSTSTECVQCAASTVSPLMPASPVMPRQALSAHRDSDVMDTDWSFEDDDVVDTSFKVMRAVLRSARAAEALGEETINSMAREVEETRARESYLLDLVQKLRGRQRSSSPVPSRSTSPARPDSQQSSTGSRQSTRKTSLCSCSTEPTTESSVPAPSCRGFGVRSRKGCTSSLLSCSTNSGAAHLESPPRLSGLSMPGSHTMTDCRPPMSPMSSMSPRQGLDSSKRHFQTESRHWTLWSFEGGALRRQDFPTEDSAWAALDANTMHPCMLRDPSGAEAAARSWVSSYFKVATAIHKVKPLGHSMSMLVA